MPRLNQKTVTTDISNFMVLSIPRASPHPLFLEWEHRREHEDREVLYAYVRCLYEERQIRDSFESPMDVWNRNMTQAIAESDAVRRKIREFPKPHKGNPFDQDAHDYEAQQVKVLSAKLHEEIDPKVQALNVSLLEVRQQEEEYTSRIIKEKGDPIHAHIQKMMAILRANPPHAPARSRPDTLTTDGSTGRTIPSDIRDGASSLLTINRVSGSDATGRIGHGEQSSGISDNSNVRTTETPRRRERSGSSIYVTTSPIRVREETSNESPEERLERKRKYKVNQTSSGESAAKRTCTANSNLLDVDRPFTAKLSPKWTEEPLINDDGTVDFHNLYRNGEVVSFCMVVEHPPETNEFYIFYCRKHNQFMRHIPLSGARRHFRKHKMNETQTADVKVKMFGVQVLNCTPELAREYNDAILPHFKGQTWTSRQKKKAAAKTAHQSNRDDDTCTAPTTQTRAPLTSLIPPARRSSRRCVSITHGTRQGENLITRPKVGDIYSVTWHRDNRDYAVLVLPIGSFDSVGIPGSILGTNLLEEGRRKCHAIDPMTGGYSWSPGYEDSGPRVGKREFPVIFFDNSVFPQKSSYGWVMAADLQAFDAEDTNIPYLKTVTEFLKEKQDRQAKGCENDATSANNRTETVIDWPPSVPAVRDNNHPTPGIDAYFNASQRYDYGTDSEDDGYSTDDSSHEPSNIRNAGPSREPGIVSSLAQNRAPVANMGREENSRDSAGQSSRATEVDEGANEPSQTCSTQQAALARLALAYRTDTAEYQNPSSPSKSHARSLGSTAVSAECPPSSPNTTTAFFRPEVPRVRATGTGGSSNESMLGSRNQHSRQSLGRNHEMSSSSIAQPDVVTPQSPAYTARQRITIDHLTHPKGAPKLPPGIK